jgi:hypothetical protein
MGERSFLPFSVVQNGFCDAWMANGGAFLQEEEWPFLIEVKRQFT